VCIVDSGVDDEHQELAGGKVVLRANFVTAPAAETGPNFHEDRNGHGSHVAGTVAARGVVLSGVAPRASLMAARTLNSSGSGSATAYVNAFRWCTDNGAQVINASLGAITYRGTTGFAPTVSTYGSAVQYAVERGVVVVVAAGNSNLRLPNPGNALAVVPSQSVGVLNVGSTGPVSKAGAFTIGGVARTLPLPVPSWNPFDPEQVWQGVDGKAFYSNYGTGVNVFAPGGRGGVSVMYPYYRYNQVAQGSTLDQIYSVCSSKSAYNAALNVGGAPGNVDSCTGNTARYLSIAGTSMASPHVAGMAAVLYAELGGERTPENRARVMSCIQSTTDDIGPASTFGGGRVNVQKAVDALRAGDC
jgi:subtilisin family serine protease